MYAQAEQTKKNKSRSPANMVAQRNSQLKPDTGIGGSCMTQAHLSLNTNKTVAHCVTVQRALDSTISDIPEEGLVTDIRRAIGNIGSRASIRNSISRIRDQKDVVYNFEDLKNAVKETVSPSGASNNATVHGDEAHKQIHKVVIENTGLPSSTVHRSKKDTKNPKPKITPNVKPAVPLAPKPSPENEKEMPKVEAVNYNKDCLEQEIGKLYKGAAPGEKEFVSALKTFFEKQDRDQDDIYSNPHFAWDLMDLVGKHSGLNLQNNIEEAKDNELKGLNKITATNIFEKPWTIRHYTQSEAGEPPYRELLPTAELLTRGIKEKSSNTNPKDWNSIGNVGFGFYLLCIDGIAPKRSFLSNCTHYAEFDITSYSKTIFVSGDMLASASGKEKAEAGFKGSGTAVKVALSSLKIDRSSPEKFLSGLDHMFPNFEVKVPGKQTVDKWHKI